MNEYEVFDSDDRLSICSATGRREEDRGSAMRPCSHLSPSQVDDKPCENQDEEG